MRGRISRRFVLGGLLAGGATSALATEPVAALRPKSRPAVTRAGVETLIEGAGLGGRLSFAVADAVTGEIIETRAPLLKLPPASVMKVVTALYGLEALGPVHRFSTRLLARGRVSGGLLEGDLILVGTGDPTLDTDALAEMAETLVASGIREVTGEFLVDASALPAIRAIDDRQPEHLAYNPAVGGLNLNYNRVRFQWQTTSEGTALRMEAHTRNFSPPVSVAQIRAANRGQPVFSYNGGNGTDNWTVAAGALEGEGSRWLPVRRPAAYAGDVLRTLAASQGVRLPQPKQVWGQAEGTELARRDSPPLHEILRAMLRWSNNLTAEVVGLTGTLKRGVAARNLGMSAREMSDWLADRMDTRKPVFKDHSGLHDGSRVAPTDLVRLLTRPGAQVALRPILKRMEFKTANETVLEVQAKTGTLHFVNALAGYMEGQNGRPLAFAIMAADTTRRSRLSRVELERPEGARAWTLRARRLEGQLIERWATF
ncbi:MAG: D-alanyl-D-alanine carboxypeptidase/D-alanyl-D-alanine-endopeptidase [Rhodobacteraceae bacterium]|nr:D-alanyl-D-alanine carboxypeptidase/D-alanyl-D-alanine-endopeptidase [Paracoccaceae bacterium]